MRNLFYPAKCLLCGDVPLDENGGILCSECVRRMPAIDGEEGEICRICGTKLISENGVCMRCRERDYLFRRNISLFEYRGECKELLRKYKFLHYRSIAGWFARLIEGALNIFPEPFYLVPAPGNPKSVHKRGWDQVSEITDILEKALHRDVRKILRRRPSREQKALTYPERCKNLEGNIFLSRKPSCKPVKNAVIIDDIFTTGATVNECARVLRETGRAEEVYVMTIAID